jgi:hypothetical protein
MKSGYACNSSAQCLSQACNQTTLTCACPSGYLPYSNKCYKTFPKGGGKYSNKVDNSNDDAQKNCRNYGGFLMSVNESVQLSYFSSSLNGQTWV